MNTESQLRADLSGDAGVSALVGTRIYPNVLPDTLDPKNADHWPAIAYHTVDAVVIGGVCKQRRMQIDYYARSYSAMKEGRDAIEDLADGKSNWQYLEGPDFYEEDTKLHHQVIDVIIS
ncbi:MAG: DUF3168 domain-containing protein [bacterium]